jgi:hypothetical protein
MDTESPFLCSMCAALLANAYGLFRPGGWNCKKGVVGSVSKLEIHTRVRRLAFC